MTRKLVILVLGSRMGVQDILIYELLYCLINDASDMELFHAKFIGTFFYSLVHARIFKNLNKLI